MKNERKIEMLERILKAITYTDEIKYKEGSHGYLLDRIQFHGANPDYLFFRGYSEGLDLDWDAETYEAEVPEEFGGGTTVNARLVGEVWVQEDLWETIQKLREKLSQLGENNDINI